MNIELEENIDQSTPMGYLVFLSDCSEHEYLTFYTLEEARICRDEQSELEGIEWDIFPVYVGKAIDIEDVVE